MIRHLALLSITLLVLLSCDRREPTPSPNPAAHKTALERQVLFRESGLLKDHFFGYTPLIQAACKGDVAGVQKALAAGADVNWKMQWGLTALMWAADQGHAPVVEILIAHGADVNAESEDGMTALMFAAKEGRTQVARILLSHKADRNRRNLAGESASDLAKEANHAAIVKLLRK